MGLLGNCINSRFCLKIRRNDTIQRAARRMDKAPNGIWSSLPAMTAFVAWILSITSSSVCSFINRSVTYTGSEDDRPTGTSSTLLITSQGLGFWGWEGEGGTCYSYEISGTSPSMDGSFVAAGALTTLTNAMGGICMVCLMLGTVFPVVPKRYEFLGYANVLVSILEFCSLVILGSNVCNPNFFNYAIDMEQSPPFETISTASCGLGLGSSLNVVAGIFWLLSGALCLRTPLASRKREPGTYRGTHHHHGPEDHHDYNSGEDDNGNSDDDNDNDNYDGDPTHKLYRQRQAEKDQRYRELMGENDDEAMSGDEEEEPGFKSVRKALSLVREEDSGDDMSGRQSRRRRSEDFDDEQMENESRSEARSNYSDEGSGGGGDERSQNGGAGSDAHGQRRSSQQSASRRSSDDSYSDRGDDRSYDSQLV